MGSDPKFDYGDQVRVKGGEYKDRLGDVAGMTITASPRTYTVEFGDGSDAEIEEEQLPKVDECYRLIVSTVTPRTTGAGASC